MGENVNAGKNIEASSIFAWLDSGKVGTSALAPSLINKFLLGVNSTIMCFGRKNSKSLWIKESGLGTFDIDDPMPSYCLEKKSNECPVTSSVAVTVDEVPAMSSTLGRKS